jgi:hypothetical protein
VGGVSDLRPGDYVWAACGYSWERCRVLAVSGGPPLLRTREGFVFKQSIFTEPRQPSLGERVYNAIFRPSERRLK